MKKLWIDTETTGVCDNAAPVQISGIIEIDGKIVEEFNIYLQPFPGASIEPSALEVNGLTMEDISNFQPSIDGYRELISIFDRYINKYDRNDKFVIGGYNVSFDIKKLRRLADAHSDPYIGSYLGSTMLDPMYLTAPLNVMGRLPKLENNKLGTWCNYFSIPLIAHDSMEDIRATRILFYTLINLFSKS